MFDWRSKVSKLKRPRRSGEPRYVERVCVRCSKAHMSIYYVPDEIAACLACRKAKKRRANWLQKLKESGARTRVRKVELEADAANKARAKRILEGIDD